MHKVVFLSHSGQVVVIQTLVLFKEDGEVKQRLMQYFLAYQIERNHQPAYPSVAVQKRMYGFKLVMGNACAYQRRHMYVFIVKEILKVSH